MESILLLTICNFSKLVIQDKFFQKKTLKAAVLSKWNLILVRVATKNYNSYPENGVFHNSRSQAIKIASILELWNFQIVAWFQTNFKIGKNYEGNSYGVFILVQSRCSEQLTCNFAKRRALKGIQFIKNGSLNRHSS